MDDGVSMIVPTSTMEDGFFPNISEGYSNYSENYDEEYKDKTNFNDEHSDLEADSMPECQIDLTEADVYTQLEHKERDLILAAELGRSLLDQNKELKTENERLQHELNEKVEILEQEKYELRRKLDSKTEEMESCSLQLNLDLKKTQELLEEHKAMMISTEREKSRAVEELSEQNFKLQTQLQKASVVENQLSSQVQELRKEFLARSASTNIQISQLETLKEEIQEESENKNKLKSNFDLMKDETHHLHDALTISNEKAHIMEKQLHEKDRELRRALMELDDSHLSNRQLQTRLDEMSEEMMMQTSFTSNTNSSLLSELEGLDCGDFLELSKNHIETNLQDPTSNNMFLAYNSGDEKTENLIDMAPDLMLRCLVSLLHGVNKCHSQLFQMKHKMLDIYQRIQTNCSIMKSFVKHHHSKMAENCNVEPCDNEMLAAMNLSKALNTLSVLVTETIAIKKEQFEVIEESDDGFVKILKEKLSSVTLEKEEAITTKNSLEIDLSQSKVDLMYVNSQLLESIQQKLKLQNELEAWQEDMEQMIQKALNENNDRRIAPPSPQPKSSWFGFRRNNQQGSNPSTPVQTRTLLNPLENNEESKPGLFSSWMKKKPDSPQQDKVNKEEDSL